jgi:hypothetical protein
MWPQHYNTGDGAMNEVMLKRVSYTRKGTFGVLTKGGTPLCVTLEDPWEGNERGVSCIPVGRYRVEKHSGTKFKDAWVLKNVPGRTAILIHIGNSIEDTSGCILVGRSFNAHTIRDSRNAMEYLKAILPSVFVLNVVECNPSVSAPVSWWNKAFKRRKLNG